MMKARILHPEAVHSLPAKKSSKRLPVLIICLQLVVVYPLLAQLMTINNVNVANSAVITLKGDLLNNAGATIANSGTIALTGNWTNNSGNNCFGTSSGTVALNGANQSVGGTDATMFNNLSLQGTGTKTLLSDETVGGAYTSPAGILELNDRYLDLNAHKLTISNATSSAITRSSGFIQSETDPFSGYSFLQWNINNAPSGSVYGFPLGDISSGDYIPFEFSVTTPGSGSSEGYIAVATYPTDPFQLPNNRPFPLGVNALLNTGGLENADKTMDRYWLIHSGNYTTAPVANLQFSYRDDDWWNGNNSINEANLQAQRLNGNVWSFPMIGWDSPSSNKVTVSNVSQYDTIWTLADNTAPLPVTLLSFEARVQENKTVLCEWVTAAQINNDHFELERSKNGTDFEKIGMVEGAGNSTSVLQYSFVDEQPYTGLSYYRLKQVDFDGGISYSEMRAVGISKKGINYYLFPNPVVANLNIMTAEDKEFEGTIRIVDVMGNIMLEKNILTGDHQQFHQVDLSSLSPGNYLVQLLSAGEFEQQKIVVMH